MSQDSDLPVDLRKHLYYTLLLQRKAEEKIAAEYPKKEMRCPTHLYIGHEAIAAGVCAALRKDDLIFPYYRSHGWYLCKGGDLKAMVSELFGRENGCSRGWGGSMHLIDLRVGVMGVSAIVGGTISHAAGAALALRLKGTDAVAVVSFGDGAVEEGVFHETMNMSALYRLPVVFVCENNLYATNTHIRYRQAQPDIYKHADRFGLPGILVDGNDVVAVYRETVRAVARARAGQGPTLLECRTYRVLEHCGIFEDYDLGYRTKEEVNYWVANGPLVKARHLVSEEEAAGMAREIEARMDEAYAHARSSPFPSPGLATGVRS